MEIREVDLIGTSKLINIDSIINISRTSFDSIILYLVSVPQDLEMASKCYDCSGSTFYSFMLLHNRLIETFKIRGFNDIIDSLLLIQHRKLYDALERHSNFQNDKLYFIITSVRFGYIEGDDDKKINTINNLGGREVVLRKRRNENFFRMDSIPAINIPKNIQECIIQLDTVLTEQSKSKIKSWDREYYETKARHEFHHWINNNWNTNCGILITGNPKNDLVQYFYNLGITEQCYITGIVMNCYRNYLLDGNIRLNEEINIITKKQ